MEFLDIYFFYIRKFFSARAEYRLNFWIGLAANFITYFFTYITYWIITTELADIAGWSFSQLCLLYGTSLLTYALAGTLLWYSVYNLSELIVKGTLDVLLVRPMGVLRQLVSNRFGDTFLAQILVTVIFLGIAASRQEIALDPGKVIYFIMILIGGVCIQAAGMIAVGTLSFWTIKSQEIGEIFYYKIRSFTRYPLSLFPVIIQKLLTFILPWAFINYYPCLLLLDKDNTKFEMVCGCISPIIGILLLIASVKFFYFGLRHYTGTGS